LYVILVTMSDDLEAVISSYTGAWQTLEAMLDLVVTIYSNGTTSINTHSKVTSINAFPIQPLILCLTMIICSSVFHPNYLDQDASLDIDLDIYLDPINDFRVCVREGIRDLVPRFPSLGSWLVSNVNKALQGYIETVYCGNNNNSNSYRHSYVEAEAWLHSLTAVVKDPTIRK
jgi:hypothetical protein